MSESFRLALSIVSLVLAVGSIAVSAWALVFVRRVRRRLELRAKELEPGSDVDFRRPWEEHP